MDIKSKKVFHGLVNYGTQSGFLARQLSKRGIYSKSVTYYDNFDRETDVRLKGNAKHLLRKLYNYVWNKLYLFTCFFRFDIFHFYYGKTLSIAGWELLLYRLFGKKIVFHYLGNDVQLYRESVNKYRYTNMTGFIREEDADDYDRRISKRLIRDTKYADIQLVCAPVYSEFVPGSSVLPLAIDLKRYNYLPPKNNGEIVVMHAPTHRGFKGTEYILEAIDRLIEEGFNIRKLLVENVTHDVLRQKYAECDIFVDQIMGGWYGTASIEAMATGRPVICSIRREYFQYIDYGDQIPVISAFPDEIYDVLKFAVKNPSEMRDLGLRSRKFVEDIHDLNKITDKLIDIYQNIY